LKKQEIKSTGDPKFHSKKESNQQSNIITNK
jgi:hypothetical protein